MPMFRSLEVNDRENHLFKFLVNKMLFTRYNWTIGRITHLFEFPVLIIYQIELHICFAWRKVPSELRLPSISILVTNFLTRP